MKFKKGDRVVVYGVTELMSVPPPKDTVTAINEYGWLVLETLMRDAHPKQCRKLKTKKRKAAWIHKSVIEANGHAVFVRMGNPPTYDRADYVRFIESKNQ